MNNINKFSLLILVLYLLALCSMESGFGSRPLEGLMLTFPLPLLFFFWASKTPGIMSGNENNKIKNNPFFERDYLIISISFFLGELIYIICNSNNTDLRA